MASIDLSKYDTDGDGTVTAAEILKKNMHATAEAWVQDESKYQEIIDGFQAGKSPAQIARELAKDFATDVLKGMTKDAARVGITELPLSDDTIKVIDTVVFETLLPLVEDGPFMALAGVGKDAFWELAEGLWGLEETVNNMWNTPTGAMSDLIPNLDEALGRNGQNIDDRLGVTGDLDEMEIVLNGRAKSETEVPQNNSGNSQPGGSGNTGAPSGGSAAGHDYTDLPVGNTGNTGGGGSNPGGVNPAGQTGSNGAGTGSGGGTNAVVVDRSGGNGSSTTVYDSHDHTDRDDGIDRVDITIEVGTDDDGNKMLIRTETTHYSDGTTGTKKATRPLDSNAKWTPVEEKSGDKSNDKSDNKSDDKSDDKSSDGSDGDDASAENEEGYSGTTIDPESDYLYISVSEEEMEQIRKSIQDKLVLREPGQDNDRPTEAALALLVAEWDKMAFDFVSRPTQDSDDGGKDIGFDEIWKEREEKQKDFWLVFGEADNGKGGGFGDDQGDQAIFDAEMMLYIDFN